MNGEKTIPYSALKLWRAAEEEIDIAIEGSSMRPTLEPGDLVRIRLSLPNRLKKGDLVAFWRNEQIEVHRLMTMMELEGTKRYCESGDNNRGWTWIDADSVLGKVVTVSDGARIFQVDRWPWKAVNRLVAFLSSPWITLHEKSRAAEPAKEYGQRRPTGKPNLFGRIAGRLAQVLNCINNVVIRILRLSGLGSSRIVE